MFVTWIPVRFHQNWNLMTQQKQIPSALFIDKPLELNTRGYLNIKIYDRE